MIGNTPKDNISDYILRILKNAGFLLLGNVGVRLLTALATILVARTIGATAYGTLAVALAFSNLASFCTDLGLSQTFIREGSKPNAHLPSLTLSALILRISFGLVTSIIILLIVPILYENNILKETILWATIPAIWGVAFQGLGAAYFQLTEQMHLTALIRAISSLFTAILLVSGIFLSWDVKNFAFAYGLGQFVGGIFALLVLIRSCSLKGKWNITITKELGYFTLGGVFSILIPQMGPLILERVASLQEVGYFSAAYRIPVILYLIPGTIAGAFYPVLFKQGYIGKDRNTRFVKIQMQIMCILGVTFALPFALYPTVFINIIFGKEWGTGTSVETLRILAWLVLVHSITIPLGDALTTRNFQKRRIICVGFSIVFGAVVHILLGMQLGAVGSAIAVISTEVIMLFCFMISLAGSVSIIRQSLYYITLGMIIYIISYLLSISVLDPLVGIWFPSLIYLLASMLIFKKKSISF
ncbi:MAG: flippase [Firmicutes bacterium]|nr:flippase [Bacillota bacterium]